MNASTRDSNFWPVDYDDSRAEFRTLAARHMATDQCFELQAKGPGQQTLSIDSAFFGSKQSKRLIIVSSGLHGVEGFVGAAVQINLMQKLEVSLDSGDTAVALVHAVNPYGFAHLRRTNEDNIDLNRNFLNDDLPRPPLHPNYPALNPLLNPANAPPPLDRARFVLHAGWQILTGGGVAALSKVIAQGQYHFPKGLFYGGRTSAESVRNLKQYIAQCLQNVSEVIHVDLHSGLGRFGEINLIASSNASDEIGIRRWVSGHLACPVRLEADPDSPYTAHGSLGLWYRDNVKDTRFLYLCAEFGTYHPLRVISALKSENQAHHWTAVDSPHYEKSKLFLLKTFAPASKQWQNNCTKSGVELIERVIHSQALPNAGSRQ